MLKSMSDELAQRASSRELDGSRAGEKAAAAAKLRDDVQRLAPLMTKHVLRKSLAKRQRTDGGDTLITVLRKTFNYASLEDAHREAEETRDRLQQEMVIRRLAKNSEPSKDQLTAEPAKSAWAVVEGSDCDE